METGKHTTCFFVADLHGVYAQYQKLFAAIANEQPHAVFLGGDLLPSGMMALASPDFFHEDFVNKVLASGFLKLKSQMGDRFPGVFLILGNDDGRMEEAAILDAAGRGAWQYSHNRKIKFQDYVVYGYSCVPPSPFQLKDWERYDVSRFVDPGCTAPDEGFHSVPVSRHELKYATIKKDLEVLTDNDDLANAIFLFHTPPYQTKLDRAALDGKMIDYAPLDVHIGSIAVRRLIEQRQPLLTLHGHVHESARLTGEWKDRIGQTVMLSAAHDGEELALVRFDPANPEAATRELI